MTAKKSGPPKVGSLASARVDELFQEDLATLAKAGMNTTDALKWAVNRWAVAFREAWARGTAPEGEWPDFTIMVGPPKEHEQDTPQAA